MSTAPQSPQPAAKNQNRRKKARAIMASGLVLGVGAAVTLAAWSDTVWGEGTFGTNDSAFNIQGNFTGADNGWDEFMTQDRAGTMQFGPKAAGMIPNETVYATVGLREQHNKMDAEVTLTKVTSDTGPLGKWITLGVSDALATKPENCANVPVAETTLLESADAKMATFDLAGGQTRWFCFSATLDPKTPANTAPTASKNIQWKFDAVSKEKVAPAGRAAAQTAE